MTEPSIYEQAAEAIHNTKNAIAVTGAGVSVESGIPDFRSPDGLWAKYPPFEYATAEALLEDPDKVWVMFYELGDMLLEAKPNPAHFALARLEEMGHLQGVITQNIDNLHQAAGNTVVVEYHGNAQSLICPACHRRRPMSMEQRALGAPRCECGGYMKPDVVLFGDPIPPQAMLSADRLARLSEVVLVVGTSAQVYPAAGLPLAAKEHGATIIEVNTYPTEFTGRITDIFLQGPAGEVLPAVLNLIEQKDSAG